MGNLANMTRYAAFLRGVNVGGVNLKMAELAAALRDAGFDNVRTILASGNVVLDARGSAASVRKKAESTLRETFGYDAWVLVYDLGTVAAIAEGYPFEPEVEGHHSYVTFVSDPAMLDELAALADRRRPAREDRPWRWCPVLAGAQVGHAGFDHRQDHGQEALQVLDHHPKPPHAGQSPALTAPGGARVFPDEAHR